MCTVRFGNGTDCVQFSVAEPATPSALAALDTVVDFEAQLYLGDLTRPRP